MDEARFARPAPGQSNCRLGQEGGEVFFYRPLYALFDEVGTQAAFMRMDDGRSGLRLHIEAGHGRCPAKTHTTLLVPARLAVTAPVGKGAIATTTAVQICRTGKGCPVCRVSHTKYLLKVSIFELAPEDHTL